MKNSTPSLQEPSEPRTPSHFWAKVDRRGPDECWPWMGVRMPKGYGRFVTYQNNVRRQSLAHRVAYELVRGSIPAGMQLDHLCRVRHCVNPAHLEPVTNQQNVLRGIGHTAVNARKTHCPKGHEYTPENTYTGTHGDRNCRICKSALRLRPCPSCGNPMRRYARRCIDCRWGRVLGPKP